MKTVEPANMVPTFMVESLWVIPLKYSLNDQTLSTESFISVESLWSL